MAITLQQYQADYQTTFGTKPIDAVISGQSASILSDGTVFIAFVSGVHADIITLRDWLNTILGP